MVQTVYMLTTQESQLLSRLLARAHPTALQRELIARLQAKGGLPIVPGPAAARVRERIERTRLERARDLTVLGGPGSVGPYFYRRMVEVLPRGGRSRRSRFHVILVDSLIPLSGAALEEAFRLRLIDFRRLIHYAGPMWYVSPVDVGREPPEFYVPPAEYYDEDYFEIPEDISDAEDFDTTP